MRSNASRSRLLGRIANINFVGKVELVQRIREATARICEVACWQGRGLGAVEGGVPIANHRDIECVGIGVHRRGRVEESPFARTVRIDGEVRPSHRKGKRECSGANHQVRQELDEYLQWHQEGRLGQANRQNTTEHGACARKGGSSNPREGGENTNLGEQAIS